MNGLNAGELSRLALIRKLAEECNNLDLAKRMALDWTRANKRRRVLREAACRTVRGIYGGPRDPALSSQDHGSPKA